MKSFSSNYSNLYDTLYQNKKYEDEVAFIDRVLNQYAESDIKTILSLGCGTCSHELILAKRGYEITGVDLSESMLTIAKEKILRQGREKQISLVQSDLCHFRLNQTFDLCMALFNVLGYQTDLNALDTSLKNLSSHLKKGALFLFDCWHLAAIFKSPPTERIVEIDQSDKRVIRRTRPELDAINNTMTIHFKTFEIHQDRILNESEERHHLRFWSLPELKFLLETNGFDLVKACNFMDLDSTIGDKNWNIFIVGRKR